MINLQKMAMDVFIPSWGEINISFAAAVVFILLVSYFHHFFSGNNTSKVVVEERVAHLPEMSELESVVVNNPGAQAVVKVKFGKPYNV